MSDRYVLTFVDNESAKHALIVGISPVVSSAKLVSLSGELDAALEIRQWCARVPTASNIADAPSRLDFSELQRDGSIGYQVFAPSSRCPLSLQRLKSWQCIADRLE